MSYTSLVNSVQELQKTKVKSLVDSKIKDFKDFKNKRSSSLFYELCFCILAANFNAKRSLYIQNQIKKGFIDLPLPKLKSKLKEFGHRFPNKRSEYIFENRKYSKNLRSIIDSFSDQEHLRDWLVKNIKGIGYKEASHFLRNIGYLNLAIVDFHIIDILEKNNLVVKPKTLNKQKYLEIEQILLKISKKVNLSVGELDLYLWYLETKSIIK
jgi:N-glycosylase/DNA lyase